MSMITSRAHRASTVTSTWTSPDGIVIDLPITVDYRIEDDSGHTLVLIEATVDTPDGQPVMTKVTFAAAHGLDVDRLQREFRWRTPIDIVTRLIPRLIIEGRDPFDLDLPLTGYPEVVLGRTGKRTQLSDDFLRLIAEEYLRLGRGYAQRIAREHGVSPRTAVSWVVKARERGILSPPPSVGAAGGRLLS